MALDFDFLPPDTMRFVPVELRFDNFAVFETDDRVAFEFAPVPTTIFSHEPSPGNAHRLGAVRHSGTNALTH